MIRAALAILCVVAVGVAGRRRRSQCREEEEAPQDRFVFPKTWKTGGSTVAGITLRYAYLRGLLVCVPRDITYEKLLHYRRDGVGTCVPVYTMRNPDYRVISAHTGYDPPQYDPQIMDRIVSSSSGNATWFTILRDPTAWLFSKWYYLGKSRHPALLSRTLRAALIRARRDMNARPERFPGDLALTFSMLQALGTPSTLTLRTDVEAHARAAARHLRQRYDFVMILERMSESLVVLRRRMRWELLDVVTYRHNANPHSIELPPSLLEVMHNVTRVQRPLYDRGVAMLEAELRRHRCVTKEVAVLDCMRARVEARCARVHSQKRKKTAHRWCAIYAQSIKAAYHALQSQYTRNAPFGPADDLLRLQRKWQRRFWHGSCGDRARALIACASRSDPRLLCGLPLR